MKQTVNSLLPYYKEIDLSTREKVRYYRFSGNEVIIIQKPKTLIVSDNGHRIMDMRGISHYIPYGWIHLWWVNQEEREVGFYCQEKEDRSSVKRAESDQA